MNRIATGALAALIVAAPTFHAFAQPAPKTQAEADAQAEAEADAKRAQQAKEDKAKAPPPAIPGAEAASPVAPADKLAADMSPNDALFDAISRGDQAAARDALNRGAQIDARNVLGQTPIDAAIDQNRTDITFLLLSERGAPTNRLAKPATQIAAAPHAKAAPTRHHRAGTVAVATAAPRQLSTDRGTPNPAVGFIGY